MTKYAGVIIRYKNQCMLCKRAPYHNFLPNVWSMPSGHVEEGETEKEAAGRELYEETGIEPKGLKFISVMENEKKKGDVTLFLMNVDEKIVPDLSEAQDGFEHTECKYFTKDKIPSTTPELKKVLEILLK